MLYTLVLTSIQADKAIANTSWKDYRLNYSETLKFSPDSSFIALTSEEARLWQVNTASENPLSLITTLKSLNPIRDITFSQDSQYIHANGLLLNTQTGTPVFENSNFTATAISSDSSTLATTTKASGNSNVEISLWNKEKQLEKVITTDSKSAITSLTFSLNNNELLSSNTDGSIILWDIATGKAIQTFETHLESLSEQIVTLTSDGKALKIGSKETIKTIDIASNTLINEVKLKINPAVDPSINYWLKNSDYDLRAFQDDVSSKIYLVSTATGEMKEFKANIRSDEYITLSGIVDDKTIAIGAGSKTYIVDIDSGDVTKSFDYTYANFNAQGTRFIGQRYNSSSTGSGYYSYHLIDVTTEKQLWEMKFNSNDSFPSDLGFTKDGSKIFYSEYQDNGKWLTLKDAANGKTLYRYKSDINLFHHQLSPDGSYIITKEIDSDQSSSFSTVGFLWSTKNGALLKKLPGLLDYGYSVAFSSDGTKLIVGSGHGNYNNTITIYSTPNNEPVFIEQSSN